MLLLLPLGYELVLGCFIACGALFCLVGLIVKKAGTGWSNVIFHTAAMGVIVALIGLELAGIAANRYRLVSYLARHILVSKVSPDLSTP